MRALRRGCALKRASRRASDGSSLVMSAIRMAFASIFVPNFMVQAVVRSEPGLRDRALALVDGTSSIPHRYRIE